MQTYNYKSDVPSHYNPVGYVFITRKPKSLHVHIEVDMGIFSKSFRKFTCLKKWLYDFLDSELDIEAMELIHVVGPNSDGQYDYSYCLYRV